MAPYPAKRSILTRMFLGKYSPSELHQCRVDLGTQILEEEDSIDNLTHLWKYASECTKSFLKPSAPKELDVFILLYLASVNEAVSTYFKEDYEQQPDSVPDFFGKFLEIVVWAFTDYRDCDIVNYENWITVYETIRNTWLSHRIPPVEELKSVCTIAERLVRKPPTRRGGGKGSRRKRGKKNQPVAPTGPVINFSEVQDEEEKLLHEQLADVSELDSFLPDHTDNYIIANAAEPSTPRPISVALGPNPYYNSVGHVRTRQEERAFFMGIPENY